MRALPLLLLTIACPMALGGPLCTNADKAQWQDQAKFQENLKAQGYEIKKFKVTDGNCYEIYGLDKDKRKVEIYFDPVSGDAMQEEEEAEEY